MVLTIRQRSARTDRALRLRDAPAARRAGAAAPRRTAVGGVKIAGRKSAGACVCELCPCAQTRCYGGGEGRCCALRSRVVLCSWRNCTQPQQRKSWCAFVSFQRVLVPSSKHIGELRALKALRHILTHSRARRACPAERERHVLRWVRPCLVGERRHPSADVSYFKPQCCVMQWYSVIPGSFRKPVSERGGSLTELARTTSAACTHKSRLLYSVDRNYSVIHSFMR